MSVVPSLPNIHARPSQQQLQQQQPQPVPRPPAAASSNTGGSASARRRTPQQQQQQMQYNAPFAQPHMQQHQQPMYAPQPYGFGAAQPQQFLQYPQQQPSHSHGHLLHYHPDDQKESDSGADYNPSHSGVGGSWSGGRFTQQGGSALPDASLQASLRAYLPLLVFQAHPGARDVPIPDAAVLSLYDIVAAHLASLGRFAPSGPQTTLPAGGGNRDQSQHHSAPLTGATVGRATLAKVQELAMTGRSFRTANALCDALRAYLAAQSEAQRAAMQHAGGAAGSEAVLGYTPTASSSASMSSIAASPFGFGYAAHGSDSRSNMLKLHDSASAAAGGNIASPRRPFTGEAEQKRLRAAAQASILDRASPAHKHSLSGDQQSQLQQQPNPYLRSEVVSDSTALIETNDPSSHALSITPAALWSEAAQQLELDVHELYDFLRGPACALWAAPTGSTSSSETAAVASDAAFTLVATAGVNAAQAGVEISLQDVHHFVSSCGGAGAGVEGSSRSLLSTVREMSAACGAGGVHTTFRSMEELTRGFLAHFHTRHAQEILLFLAYSEGGDGLLLNSAAASASSSGKDWVSQLTLADAQNLIKMSGAGLWTLTHLRNLALQRASQQQQQQGQEQQQGAAAPPFSSLAELGKALHALENVRAHHLAELHAVLSAPDMLRVLFVPSARSRMLRPSQQRALGITELPEPLLPTISLQQAAEVMYECGAGNDTLKFLRVLAEQMEHASLLADANDTRADVLVISGSGSGGSEPALRPFASLGELIAALRDMVLKEELFHALRAANNLWRWGSADCVTPDAVASLVRHVLSTSAQREASGVSSPRLAAAEAVRALLREGSGHGLVQLVRGLDRVRWRRFDDVQQLIVTILGDDDDDESNAAAHDQEQALVSVQSSSDEPIVASPAAPVLMRYVINQLAERKRTYLFLLSPAGSALYTGARLSVTQIDALYEASGVGLIHHPFASSRSACFMEWDQLLPHLRALVACGTSVATGTALVAALQYRLESVLVHEYLRSQHCFLLRVPRPVPRSGAAAPQPTPARSSPSSSQNISLHLTQGDVDLLLAEMQDRERDLGLLVPLLRKLNTEYLARKAEQGESQDNGGGEQSLAPAFVNLQQLLAAVRHEYHLVQHERHSVLAFLRQDPAARAQLLTASKDEQQAPATIGLSEVAELIHRSRSSPDTLRMLRSVVASGTRCPTLDSLVAAVKRVVATQAQEQWRILHWLSNGVTIGQAAPSSASAAGKPHNLFRHCHVRNTIGGTDATGTVSSSDENAITLTSQCAARLYAVAGSRTLSFLRALDVSGVALSARGALAELEGMVKHMEMKRRVLRFLNSERCTLFVRRGQQQGLLDDAEPLPPTSIPSVFTGRDVELLWTQAQSGLATLSYLRLLESRVGSRAQHRSATGTGGSGDRIARGQYTTFAALVADVSELHSKALLQRKQVLAFLVQSSTELDSAAGMGASASVDSNEAGGIDGESNHLRSGVQGSSWSGVHHLFRDMTFPFEVTPALVDELFEGQVFDEQDDDETAATTADEQQGNDSLRAARSSQTAGLTNPTSLFLLHSASLLPLLLRMDRVQHLSFRSWSALRLRLGQELARVEEEKLAVLLFLSLESNLLVEYDYSPLPLPTTPSTSNVSHSQRPQQRVQRMQLGLADIDELYERFQFLERGIPVLRLLRMLAATQRDALEEQYDLLSASTAATAAARTSTDPAVAPVPDFGVFASSSDALASHAFFSLQELGQALELAHTSALFWAQKVLHYLRFPAHGNLLSSSLVAADVAANAARAEHDEESTPSGQQAVIASSSETLSRSLLARSQGSSDALVALVHTSSSSSNSPLSYAVLESLLDAAGMSDESPALLLPFLVSLDANHYRFDSPEQLAQAVGIMVRQWSGATTTTGQQRDYKRVLLRFLLDFHRATAGLFELSAVPHGSGAAAAGEAVSLRDAERLLPFGSCAEPIVSVTLEHLDALQREVAAVTSAQQQQQQQQQGGRPSVYPAELVLLTQLRLLAAQAPRFSSFADLISAARSGARGWAKAAATLHRFLNDPNQCALLPSSASSGQGEQQQQQQQHRGAHSREERSTRLVSMDQVVHIMLSNSNSGSLLGTKRFDEEHQRSRETRLSPFAAKLSRPVVVAEQSSSNEPSTGAAILPVNDVLERLLELDASGRTFSSVASLITGLRRAQAALAACKRRVLLFMRDSSEGRALFNSLPGSIPPSVNAAAVERLFSACRTGFHTLALLRSLAARQARFVSWSALHQALLHEHEERLGPQIKVMRFLLHPDSKGLFHAPTVSAGAAASSASSTAGRDGSGAAQQATGASFGPPVKLSLQLVSRMYHAVGAGSSMLNYLMALQAQAVAQQQHSTRGQGQQASFGSLAALQDALQVLVNRDRVLFWLEREREHGSLFTRVHTQHKHISSASEEVAALSFVLSPAVVDEFIAAAGTGSSTLMYLQQLARLAVGCHGTSVAADNRNADAGRAQAPQQFSHLFELVPVLQRMHADSRAARRRVLHYLNDRSVQKLLVSRHATVTEPSSLTNDGDSTQEDDAPEAAADFDLEEVADELMEDADAADSVDVESHIGHAGNEQEQFGLPIGQHQPRSAHVMVSPAQVDALFEQAGAHSFTLQHLQSLAHGNSRSFYSIPALARAVRALEQASLAQRDEVLVYLSFLSPSFVAAQTNAVAGAETSDGAGDADASASLVTRADVDELFLQSAAGASTLHYLRLLHSGLSFLPSLLSKISSVQALALPSQFADVVELAAAVGALHQQGLEQRLRVLQFLNDRERCTLLLPTQSAATATGSGGDQALAQACSPPAYVPLSAVEALFRSSGAGILTLPLLLALQAARFAFHSMQELAWSVKTAYGSWDTHKKRVFALVLQHGAPAANSGARSRLLDLGGQTLDARTARPVDLPVEEVISISDVDHLFETTQAGPYILAHLQHVLLLQEQEAAASAGGYGGGGARLSTHSFERGSATGGFHSWNVLVQAVSTAHDEYIARIHHLLLAHKHLLFAPSVSSSLQFTTGEIAQKLLLSPSLASGALGTSVPFYLVCIVRAQEALLGVFERVDSLEALGTLLATVHARDVQARFAVHNYLSNPANFRSLLRVVAGAGGTGVQLSMAAVHRLFDQVGIVSPTAAATAAAEDDGNNDGVMAEMHKLQQAGRRFTSFDALGAAILANHDRAVAERRAVHAFLNDHTQQKLFSNLATTPNWTHAQVAALCSAAGSGPSTLTLLAQFDSLQLRFNSLADLAVALHNMSASDERERAQVLSFLHEAGFHLLGADSSAVAASSSSLSSSRAPPSALVATMRRLGVDHPALDLADHQAAAMQPLAAAVTSNGGDVQRRALNAKDVAELWSLTRLGPHLLRMLKQLVEQQPVGTTDGESEHRITYASVAELASAVIARFDAEVSLKRTLLTFLRSSSMRWGVDERSGHLLPVPEDVDVVVDQQAQSWHLRTLERISLRNQPDPGLRQSNPAPSHLVGGMDLNPPDECHHLAPSGRRHTQIQFNSAEALFDYALSYHKHEERVAHAILRLLRDPLRCAVLPEAEAARLTLAALEGLLDRLDDGRRICLCDAMGDLYTAILELEKAGVTVSNIDELFEALRVALNGARNKAQLLRQFLHDPKRCTLFPLHGNKLSLPADLESRLIVGNEGAFMGGNALSYCQLLSYTVANEARQQQSADKDSAPLPAKRTFATTDELLAELHNVHAAHANARRALFQWLNSPAHCSLIRPFSPVLPSQVDELYHAHLMHQASQLINRHAVPPQATGGATAAAVGGTHLIELHSTLLNMQSLNYFYPSFAALSEAVRQPQTLVTFGVPRTAFMQALQERDSVERQADLASSMERQQALLAEQLAAVAQERLGMPRHSDAEFNEVSSRAEELARNLSIQAERALAEATRADQAQAAFDRVSREMAQLKAQRQTDAEAREKEMATLREQERLAQEQELQSLRSQLAIAVAAASTSAAAAALAAASRPSPSDSASPDASEPAVAASSGAAAAAALPAPLADVPDLSESDTALFVDYLGQTLLFSDLDEGGDGLAVEASQLARVAALAGGVNEALFVMKALDALGHRYKSFAALIPDVAAAVARSRASEASAAAAAAARSATPAPSGRSSSDDAGVAVGAPVISEVQMPEESPAASPAGSMDMRTPPLNLVIESAPQTPQVQEVAPAPPAASDPSAAAASAPGAQPITAQANGEQANSNNQSPSEAIMAYLSSEECKLFSNAKESLVIEPAALDALLSAGDGSVNEVLSTLHKLDACFRRFTRFDDLIPAVSSARASGSHIGDAASTALLDYLGGEHCRLFAPPADGGAAAEMEITVESMDALVAAGRGIDSTLDALRAIEAQGKQVHAFDELRPLVIAHMAEQPQAASAGAAAPAAASEAAAPPQPAVAEAAVLAPAAAQ